MLIPNEGPGMYCRKTWNSGEVTNVMQRFVGNGPILQIFNAETVLETNIG